ncbi:TPA: hypothetical protein ACH3X2_005704 [Trebouxia sp. C0005]
MKRKAAELQEVSRDEAEEGSEDQTSHSNSDSTDSSRTAGSEDSTSGSDSEGNEEVDVNFEFFDPQEVDFHGLKALLQTYLDGSPYNCSELVDTVIKQKTVGTVVKTTDSVDPIALLTVLPLRRYTSLTCLKEIKTYVGAKCNSKTQQSFQQAWDDAHTGLLLSERLVNCPPQLAPPLNQALFDEITWAQEDEPTQELRDSFKLKQYILVSRVFTDPSAPLAAQTKKQKVGKPQDAVIVYARPEDEFYHKHCSWSCTFPITTREVEKDELHPLRMVLGITSQQAVSARQEMDQVVGNAAT